MYLPLQVLADRGGVGQQLDGHRSVVAKGRVVHGLEFDDLAGLVLAEVILVGRAPVMYCPSWEARRYTTVWDCGGASASRSVAQRRSRINLAGCPSVTEVDSALISIVGPGL